MPDQVYRAAGLVHTSMRWRMTWRPIVAMVAVAQLVESRIVIPAVVGSSPIRHPKNQALTKP